MGLQTPDQTPNARPPAPRLQPPPQPLRLPQPPLPQPPPQPPRPQLQVPPQQDSSLEAEKEDNEDEVGTNYFGSEDDSFFATMDDIEVDLNAESAGYEAEEGDETVDHEAIQQKQQQQRRSDPVQPNRQVGNTTNTNFSRAQPERPNQPQQLPNNDQPQQQQRPRGSPPRTGPSFQQQPQSRVGGNMRPPQQQRPITPDVGGFHFPQDVAVVSLRLVPYKGYH
jgi:hypothetical protein